MHVVHIHVTLSLRSIVWYQSHGCDVLRWEGNRKSGIKVAMRHRLQSFIHRIWLKDKVKKISIQSTLLIGYSTLYLYHFWRPTETVLFQNDCQLCPVTCETGEKHIPQTNDTTNDLVYREWIVSNRRCRGDPRLLSQTGLSRWDSRDPHHESPSSDFRESTTGMWTTQVAVVVIIIIIMKRVRL